MTEIDFSVPRRQSVRGLLLIFMKEGRKMVKIFWPAILPFLFNKELDNKLLVIALVLLGGLLLLLLHAILYYRNFRFYIDEQQFIVRKGYLNRTTLTIPLSGIQNVRTNQTVLQQALEVMSLKVDTAGTNQDELSIHALSVPIAVQLAKVLSAHLARKQVVSDEIPDSADREELILHLQNRDLLKIGISQNHFKTLVLLLLFGLQFFYQMEDYFEEKAKEYSTDFLVFISNSGWVLLLSLAVGFLLIAILYSMIRTVVLFYDLKFYRLNNTYRIVSGLLNRKNLLVPYRKIQQMNWETGPIKKLFGIYRINIRQTASDHAPMNQIIEIPGCLSSHLEQMRADLFGVDQLSSQPLIRSSVFYFRRYWIYWGWIPSAILAGISIVQWELLLPSIFWVLFSGWYFWRLWKKSYFQLSNHHIRVSSGAIAHKFKQMEFHKVQHLEFSQSIFLRKRGIGSLKIGNSSGFIRIPFINSDLARSLYDYLLFYAETSHKSWM